MLVRLDHLYIVDPTLGEFGGEELMLGASHEERGFDPPGIYIESTGNKYKLLKSVGVPPRLANDFIAIYKYCKLTKREEVDRDMPL